MRVSEVNTLALFIRLSKTSVFVVHDLSLNGPEPITQSSFDTSGIRDDT